MRFNIFRNKYADVDAKYLMDNFDQAVRNQTEDYWRKTIAEEIYNACPDINDRNPYPCEDCFEYYEFVMAGKSPRK